MRGSFFFVTSDVIFEEGKITDKGAKIFATFMKLNVPSRNGRIYRIEEGVQLAQSLIGKSIKFGVNWLGKHVKDTSVVGRVTKAWKEGNEIKGIINIFDKGVIETIKAGTKYLFSVGGVADFDEVIQKGKDVFHRLWNAVCTHLQLLPNNPNVAGFPTAKMHKVIEINESVLLCNDGSCKCRVLDEIQAQFEEAKQDAIAKDINMTVAKIILDVGSAAVLEYIKSSDQE